MDNLCHTLVGAAMGEAGLKRRTRYGYATLMIAANLPDLDVLVFATGLPSVAFRRGWTHGVLAQVLLPLVLTAVVTVVGKWRDRSGPARERGSPGLSVPWLLALAFIGVSSHVLLDFLNNYGVRLLAPFEWRWFYGDAVFIIDVWLWAALGAGVWLARRMGRPAAARGALVFAACYIVVMLASSRAARTIVADAWRQARGIEPAALMVGPVPITPLRWEVIVDAGDHYETGVFSWPAGVTFTPGRVPKNDHAGAVARALEAPVIRAFLVWSRFPYWEMAESAGGIRVTVRDMRFAGRFSATTVVSATGGSGGGVRSSQSP